MCDRHGDYRVPDFARFKPSRRRFLGGTAAALTLAVGPGMIGRAAAATGIKSTHGTGLLQPQHLPRPFDAARQG